MKHVYLNLKRFDIPVEFGGVNRSVPAASWAQWVIGRTQQALRAYQDTTFSIFFPEAHLLSALGALEADSPLRIGCQGVHWEDAAPGGNIGALTSLRPAAAMAALGLRDVIIGHCEERRALAAVLSGLDASHSAAIDSLLNRSATAAQHRGFRILFCVGEKLEDRGQWQQVLSSQLRQGLDGIDPAGVTIAYEPVWSIGPGRPTPEREEIAEVAGFIRESTGLPVVYGGGLKRENAAMLASIPEIDGGLIALTSFTGDIGFNPEEYLAIVDAYLKEEVRL